MKPTVCGVFIAALIAASIGGCEVIEETGEAIGLAGGDIDQSDVDAVLDDWH